jgi:hypothetical protein
MSPQISNAFFPAFPLSRLLLGRMRYKPDTLTLRLLRNFQLLQSG